MITTELTSAQKIPEKDQNLRGPVKEISASSRVEMDGARVRVPIGEPRAGAPHAAVVQGRWVFLSGCAAREPAGPHLPILRCFSKFAVRIRVALALLESRTAAWLILGLTAFAFTTPVAAQELWPAEAIGSSENLTAIEGPGANDFHSDLSAAVWNPLTRRLWLGRNGPGGTNSKLWAVAEDGNGSFEIASKDGNRGEWTNFGDLEGVTQADFSEEVVYLMIEGEERIKEYDVSTYGTAILNNNWNTRTFLPRNGGSGAEGITFVPDSALISAGFVDQNGDLYTSTQGMGGLMFVGHQNGGAIFVFDLNRGTEGFVFVGEYLTGQADTSGLEFDRSTGRLYMYHDKGIDILSVSDMASTPVSGLVRRLNILQSYNGPAPQNNEGIAVFPADECVGGERSFFLTIDDGGDTSLSWYKQFTDGCTVGNTAPIANPGGFTVDEGGLATSLTNGVLSVLDGDSDPEGAPLTAVLISEPSHGSLSMAEDGTFSYSHDGSETTSDSFTYRANDGELDSNTVTISIAIAPVNDPPLAVSDDIEVDEGGTATSLTDAALSVLDGDSDPEGNPLTAVLISDPTHGSLSLADNGTFIYSHDGSETTIDSFTYRANDGELDSNTVTISISIAPVNDPPLAVSDAVEVDEGGTATALTNGVLSVLDGDSDPEGNPLTAVLFVYPTHGNLSLSNNGTFSYSHDGSETTSDSFTYRANDGELDSNTVTISISIEPVNDPPLAVSDAIEVDEGGTATALTNGVLSVLDGDSDPEGDSLTAELISDPTHGSLSLAANGTFSYSHDGSETTSDTFSYRANDGTDLSAITTVTVTVNPVRIAAVPSMGLLGLIMLAAALLSLSLLEQPRHMR